MLEEVREHLILDIIPFWKALRDEEYGGYYGWKSFDGTVDQKAEKGCILNSRITWFFANAYTTLREESLLDEARHGYEFLRDHCLDHENGGIFWSLKYDATPSDTMKHTYNQAFCIYALASYYEASGDKEALELAYGLFRLIEEKCTDEIGYLEAFDRTFQPISNEYLSENGVMADKTMNTLLHVFEAYSELYRVDHDQAVGQKLRKILDTFADKVYDPVKKRQEVFFDAQYNSILDLHSYGHDIETAWLIDRGVENLQDPEYEKKMTPITKALTQNIYEVAFDGQSLANECEKGVVDQWRIWWVQAETLIGFLNGHQKDPADSKYLEAARAEWKFIKEHVMDPNNGKEWFWRVDSKGRPDTKKPIVEPWKCPYHNGRMCLEVIRRLENDQS